FASEIVRRYGPERIVVSIDIRDGLALGEGWRQGAAGIPAEEAIETLAAAGVDTFEVTAIERDGSLEGPDLALLRSLVGLERGRIIASGGISSVEDVLAVQAAGCGGAIVGKAIYEGRVDLARLLDTLREANR
ncbi:MAG TPA: HisA/HisF-related TIM barrel protein, partial [Candidatus Limnocylindrales bacterium]|nr:HisA/HisF-related TIM barrel protein [Candidatus Limnocylindrales bacterium]